MMRRRDFLACGVGAAVDIPSAGSSLSDGDEAITWSSAENGLRLGLRFETGSSPGQLLVFLKNVGPTPTDVFVALSDLERTEFTTTSPDGKEYALADLLLYRPCAGLCEMPVAVHLDSGAIRQSTFAMDRQFYVPSRSQYTSFGMLGKRGYSLRAAFEVTGQQLKDAALRLKNPWLGRVVSPDIRASQLSKV